MPSARLLITIEDNPVQLEVGYDYVRGNPGCRYLRNGDPGYPPEPDEFDVREISIITDTSTEPAPAWLHSLLARDDHFIERLAEKHYDD